MNIKDIKIGQEIWFAHPHGPVGSGIVKNIFTGLTALNHPDYLVVKGTRKTSGTGNVFPENCFATEKELTDYLAKQDETKINKYCNSIKNIDDLVRFCLIHLNTNDCVEREIYRAAEIRANELLGIDIGTIDK